MAISLQHVVVLIRLQLPREVTSLVTVIMKFIPIIWLIHFNFKVYFFQSS